MLGTLELNQHNVMKNKISYAFETCLRKFKQEKGVVEQQDNLLEAVRKVEDLYINARYEQAYERFYQLCEDYPGYRSQAASILSRYNQLQNQRSDGTLNLSEYHVKENKILLSFETCLRKFKRENEVVEQRDDLLETPKSLSSVLQADMQELENIRLHFIASRYLEAFQALSGLCHNNKKYNEFSEAADNILIRHNELEQDVMFGRLPTLTEEMNRRKRIKLSYHTIMSGIQHLHASYTSKSS